MMTFVYRSKTFIIESPTAVNLMLEARRLRESGDLAAADFVRAAVEAEAAEECGTALAA